MSVTDVQHVYIRHAHTCIRHASGVLTEDMLTPAACMIMPELNMLTPAGYMIMPEPEIAATGLRKLKDYWPKIFVTNCFN